MKGGRVIQFSLERPRRAADRVARRVSELLRGGGDAGPTVRRFPWLMLAIGAALAAVGASLILSAALGWPYASQGGDRVTGCRLARAGHEGG